MKSKRAKAKHRPVTAVKKPTPEQCWYCELNADAGAEATIVLTKPDDDFKYFAADPEEEKLIATQVEIPRCAECQAAHKKVEDPLWMTLLLGFAAVALLGIYLGIFIKTLSWWTYLAIGLGVSGAVIGIAVGASRNLFTLPGNIKELSDVKKEKQVQALITKGWTIKK